MTKVFQIFVIREKKKNIFGFKCTQASVTWTIGLKRHTTQKEKPFVKNAVNIASI